MNKEYKLNKTDIYIIFACFLIYLTWAIVIPYDHCPDEHMRYAVPQFIYKYGYLPHGGDERIIDTTWGFSYAFTPILSYIISVFFMRFTSLFTTSGNILLLSARMVSVLASTGTVFFSIKISKKIFPGMFRYIFVIGTALLPQFVFISSYVNNDAYGIFTVAWIIYALILAEEKNWNLKSCIFLGIGVGLCLLSYYNCYGIIPIAFIYAIISVYKNEKIEHKGKIIASRTIVVLVLAFLVAGWWFVRNAIIYDGDFLGLEACEKCAEKYAVFEFKPSQRTTIKSLNLPFRELLSIYCFWARTTYESFIGNFDYMTLPLPTIYYMMFFVIIILSFVGMIVLLKSKTQKKDLLFDSSMAAMCILTVALNVSYSYFSDFQPQGRYCMPMLISLNVLLVRGWSGFFKKENKKAEIIMIISLVFVYTITIIESIDGVLIPAYL